ncbi:hypothetical protein DIS24_g3307 [Lasiodiplodia hormozganensis]|uniref:Uncharacterized protein n=1 Tax=Lasiodiplodia hormozganensis TaxID=869390 RepID=A0AA39YXJ3_9PEZI|nr:hypothetical protein DIS24_g3307 [Lasiodiplodia hormozganensis]
MPSDDDDDSPTNTINRDTFVPPFTPLKRVQSLQSREPSIIDDWSEPPSPKDGYLGRWTASRLFSMSFSLLMAVVAIHATGVACMIALMHGKPEDHNPKSRSQRHLRELNAFVTLMPILFATIMGRFFRAFALWRAQKGITVGNLERFIGCQSMYTALHTQLAMRPFSIIGLLIMAIWVLPPIASQAFLHLIDLSDTYVFSTATVKYLRVSKAAQDTVKITQGASMPLAKKLLSSGVFFQMALLMHAFVNSPQDFKGYVKVPSVHSLTPAKGGWDPTEWRHMDHSRPIAYSSLMGIPIAGLKDGANTTANFQFPSRHWTVICSDIESSELNPEEFAEKYNWDRQAFAMDLALPDGMRPSQSFWPMRVMTLKGNPSADAFADRVLDYQSYGLPLPKVPVNVAHCTIGVQKVVSNVSCLGLHCEVDSMLLLNEVQSYDNPVQYPSSLNAEDQAAGVTSNGWMGWSITKSVWNPGLWDDIDKTHVMPAGKPLLEDPSSGTPVQGLRMVLQTLPLASALQEEILVDNITDSDSLAFMRYKNAVGATNAELWLDGNNDGFVSRQYYPWPDYSSIPLEEFSARLETLINTWWQAFFMPAYYETNLQDHPIFDKSNRLIFKNSDPSTPFNDTAASISEPGPRVYRCRWGYIFVVLITSIIMTTAAGATIVFNFLTIAPNVLGFASTYTRDNANIPDSGEGSYMSGTQRASALSGVKVRIGDVKAREAVGHISLTTDLRNPTALRKDRQYD